MVVRLVSLRVHPDRQAELADVLATSYPQVRAVAGCRALYILQDNDDPLHYLTWSVWDAAADLDAYRGGPVYAVVWPRIRACLAVRASAQTFEIIE